MAASNAHELSGPRRLLEVQSHRQSTRAGRKSGEKRTKRYAGMQMGNRAVFRSVKPHTML